MPIIEPSGNEVYSPKLTNQSVIRKFIGQGGYGYVAIGIVDQSNVPTAPTSISLQVWFNDVSLPQPPANPWGVQVVNVSGSEITNDDVGKYHYDIGPQYTQDRGLLTAQWSYTVNGNNFTYLQHMQILNPMPQYDALTDIEQLTVEQVTWMIGDLFDSTDGGPWLKENFQTHFDYNRLAQMYQIAVQRMNLIGFPVTSFQTGQGTNMAPQQFNGLMIFGLYLEVVRHLRDSYVEIPLFQQMNVTFTDRRDYFQRWDQVWKEDWPDYQRAVKYAKRSLLNLGRGSLLVAGGIYGGNALGLFQVGTYASQTRSWRFYPAAPALFFSASGVGR